MANFAEYHMDVLDFHVFRPNLILNTTYNEFEGVEADFQITTYKYKQDGTMLQNIYKIGKTPNIYKSNTNIHSEKITTSIFGKSA